MNHVYRVIWNGSAACWQAVSETARGRSKSSKSSTKLLKPLLVAASVAMSGVAMAAPTGGTVASGTASIGVSGTTTTINQSTAKAVINWNDFSIANGETVNFVQPDANAITLNRVTSATASSIQGALNANGQVFIVNPNGITFGSTAQVNVGGLVASTLDITDANFNNGAYRFSGSSNAGITNQGAITVANTGTAALIAPSIQQAGSIVNNDGSILLTAASDVSLSLSNRVLNSQTINAGHNTATINNSAGTLQADGGKVILTAQGVNASSSASISSAGTIRSQTLAGNDRGAIDLIADSASGVVTLTGTLDASAPTNGFGGTIRTIAADVAVSNTASVTTRKVNQTNLPGTSSYWQIKANSINVGSGGTISGSKLSSSLNDGSVTLTASGTGTGQGSININDAVSTNSNVIFSLAANKDINFNNNVGLTANLGRLILSYGSSNDYNLNNNSKITLSGAGATLRINSTDYTVINSLGVAGDTSTTTLQGMKNNLTGNYVLGSDIDASATSGWNSGKGFDPIGSYGTYWTIYQDANAPGGYGFIQGTNNTPFAGQFHGLGHTVTNLYINRPDVIPTEIPATLPATFNFNSVGLFGATSNLIRDTSLVGSNITGTTNVGALTGTQLQGLIKHINVAGTVNGSQSVGGLIGLQQAGTASYTASSATVSGASQVGGLVGTSGVKDFNSGVITSSGLISNSSSTGAVNGNSRLGGLVGLSYSNIQNSHSSVDFNFVGNFNASSVGGLVGGMEGGIVSNSYATGNVAGQVLSEAGGLVGYMTDNATVTQSYSTGSINSSSSNIGGLVGKADGGSSIVQSHANGDVSATSGVGGLIGSLTGSSSVSQSYAEGDVTATNNNAGGLVGSVSGSTISNSYSQNNVVQGTTKIGGLVGSVSTSTINDSHSNSDVVGKTQVGGLIGSANTTTINRSYATGSSSVGQNSSTGSNSMGGLIGFADATTINNSYSTASVGGETRVGGLVGSANAININDSYSDSNNTSIIALKTDAGGLVGYINSTGSSINNSYSNGSVLTFEGYAGGLVGNNYGPLTISGSHFSGNVSSGSMTGNGRAVAGLIGMSTGGTTVENSFNSGSISGSSSVGGIIGEVTGGITINNSHNSGDIIVVMPGSYNNYAGGLIGQVVGDTTIYRSFNNGSIHGGGMVGGLIGTLGLYGGTHGIINQSYNTGAVTAEGDGAGGLAAYIGGYGDALIVDSYNKGSVTGISSVSGLAGATGIVTAQNVYNDGLVTGTSYTGGLFASENIPTISGYWDTIASGQSTSGGGTGKTTAELKQIATFTGWDIADVSNTTSNSTWVIDENNSTPWLR